MRPDHACNVFAVRRGEEVSILERRMTMERRIRGELTLREALQELDKGNDVIVLQPRTLDMVENDFIISELGEWLKGCHLLVMEKKAADTGTKERTVKQEAKKPRTTQKKVGVGKIMALHKAGWTGKAIADELKVSEATVSTYLKKLQEGKNEKVAD